MKRRIFSVTRKDLIRTTFTTSGNGGSKRNATQNGVRYSHPPSGAVGQATEHREQSRNDRLAFERMAKSDVFQNWCRAEASRRLGASTINEGPTPEEIWKRINELVDNDLINGNIVIEEF